MEDLLDERQTSTKNDDMGYFVKKLQNPVQTQQKVQHTSVSTPSQS